MLKRDGRYSKWKGCPESGHQPGDVVSKRRRQGKFHYFGRGQGLQQVGRIPLRKAAVPPVGNQVIASIEEVLRSGPRIHPERVSKPG